LFDSRDRVAAPRTPVEAFIALWMLLIALPAIITSPSFLENYFLGTCLKKHSKKHSKKYLDLSTPQCYE
jgi:hypothetical protein